MFKITRKFGSFTPISRPVFRNIFIRKFSDKPQNENNNNILSHYEISKQICDETKKISFLLKSIDVSLIILLIMSGSMISFVAFLK